MKIWNLLIMLVITLLLITACSRSADHDAPLAQTTLPDGTRILVMQLKNEMDSGYKIDLYFKEPEQPWGWCYLDHEDTRWKECIITHDPTANNVRIWKGDTLRGLWERTEKRFYRPNVPDWFVTAPQEQRDPPLNEG